MSNSNREGYSVEPITHKDLDEALEKQEKRIEKLFEAKLDPVIENLKSHEKALFGLKGSNGLVGNVKFQKWAFRLFGLGFTVLFGKVFIL